MRSRAAGQHGADVGGADHVVGREDHEALDEVAQLADVAGKAVGRKYLDGVVLDADAGSIVGLRREREEVAREQRDVLAARAQRRDVRAARR